MHEVKNSFISISNIQRQEQFYDLLASVSPRLESAARVDLLCALIGSFGRLYLP